MARIRTIKPEFWKHEALSELPESTHLLAAALLNYADDFGYFNANPKLVQAECSPLREPSVSIPESFRRLQAVGYIRLGTGADGRRYGMVIHFSEHQRVSHPTKSKIEDISITWDDSDNPPENFGRPPDNFAPERKGTGNRERNKKARSADADVVAPSPPSEPSELKEAVDAYNEVAAASKWPKVEKMTAAREARLKARLRDCGGIEGWRTAMARAGRSGFLVGEIGRSPGHENWKPDFDFLTTESKFTKLMEGGYDGSESAGKRSKTNRIFEGLAAAAANAQHR